MTVLTVERLLKYLGVIRSELHFAYISINREEKV
jgi:hypothetical protein